MKIIFVLFLLVGIQSQLSAQDERCDQIYDRVETMDSILESCNEAPSYCGYYLNELHVNKNGEQWRAVGQFDKKVMFYYTDDPTMVDEEPPLSVLKVVKVVIESTYHLDEYFFFEEGKLIYYSRHLEASDGTVDTEVCFSNDQVICSEHQRSNGSEETNSGFEVAYFTEASNYQKLFLASF